MVTVTKRWFHNIKVVFTPSSSDEADHVRFCITGVVDPSGSKRPKTFRRFLKKIVRLVPRDVQLTLRKDAHKLRDEVDFWRFLEIFYRELLPYTRGRVPPILLLRDIPSKMWPDAFQRFCFQSLSVRVGARPPDPDAPIEITVKSRDPRLPRPEADWHHLIRVLEMIQRPTILTVCALGHFPPKGKLMKLIVRNPMITLDDRSASISYLILISLLNRESWTAPMPENHGAHTRDSGDFEALPNEIVMKIATAMPALDVLNLAWTSSRWHDIVFTRYHEQIRGTTNFEGLVDDSYDPPTIFGLKVRVSTGRLIFRDALVEATAKKRQKSERHREIWEIWNQSKAGVICAFIGIIFGIASLVV